MHFSERFLRARRVSRHFFYGLTGYEFERHAAAMREELEALFILNASGTLIGVPVLPPIFSLRFLPYLVPQIAAWKKKMARPKEFWEREAYDLHGV